MKTLSKLLSTTVGCLALLSGAPAHADDSEVFTSVTVAAGVKPNVLFIIDTSGSMDTKVNVFNPAKTYAGSCDPNKVYWRSEDTAEPPDCATTTQWVQVGNNRCRAAYDGMSSDGWWRGRSQMLIRQTPAGVAVNPTYWGDFVSNYDTKIECRSDDAVHGDLPGSTAAGGENKRARNGSGTNDSNRWGTGSLIDWSTKNRYSLYSGNYANWYASTDDGDTKTRLEIVRDVAKNLITTLNGVNLGIMRYDNQAHGGMVMYPVSELNSTSRTAMKTLLDGFTADGFTPLSETMYEAYRYMAGRSVGYGNASAPSWSVASSRTGGTLASKAYDSPMDFSCQSNYIVYLTDGLPTRDNESDTEIETTAAVKCPAQIDDPDPDYPTSGRCLEAITNYMNKTDLRADVTGDQKVVTYLIGFGDEVAKSATFMKKVAVAGGTDQPYTQNDAAGLTATLEEIFTSVQSGADTTFVAPAVSVNAFNRSQNLNELYVSVFAPSKLTHWAGNLKKYRFYKKNIYGTSGTAPAADANGFFAAASQAINTTDGNADGPSATKGGAAGSLPTPSSRNLYTWIAGQNKDLTNGDNAIITSNPKVTAAMLGAVDADERALMIDYARGVDVHDENKNGSTTDQHYRMGDPMHARPAILIHGGTEAKPEGTIFVPTNDGFLHAFKMNSTAANSDGSQPVTPTTERWAFVPEDFLGRLGLLYDDAPLSNRTYALDGDVRVLKFDVDGDGIVEAGDGDKAYIYFGTGRGGSTYYSLDVTAPDTPKFRWKISNATTGFGKLGKTWSAPRLARVNISGATQNGEKLVLIFGGGYDTAEDADPTTFSYISEDSVGNAIYMVDADTGALLWTGSKTGVAGANFTHASMTHAIPSSITVIDTNGDDFVDRMYAADLGGQVWRFDITNGNAAGSLVAGGPLASLGNKALATPNVANNRRFYNSPDVSLTSARGSAPYYNIAIGSGYRGHPLNTKTQDSFYSLRDYAMNARNQAWFNSFAVIKDGDTNLIDVTTQVGLTIGDTKSGWKLRLKESTLWRGEKALSESTTADGFIFFTTFTPITADPSNPCLAGTLNRVWALSAANADPLGRNTSAPTGPPTPDDRKSESNEDGIQPGVNIYKDPDGGDDDSLCVSGATVLKQCVPFGSAIRSYWEHN
jgi:type IV pilus assembly protein PilY1